MKIYNKKDFKEKYKDIDEKILQISIIF